MKTRHTTSNNMEDYHESSPLEESDDFFEDIDDTSDLPTSLIVTNVDISVYRNSDQRVANRMKTRHTTSNNMEDYHESSPLEVSDDFFEDIDDTSDLPTSLIVTNVDISVYTNSDQRTQFEELFQRFDSAATFHYLKSFRRVRVVFESPDAAAQARIQCHQMKFGESVLNCYFAQASSPDGEGKDGALLQPPLPQRQFLISPPASPPVGWAPSEEAEPCISYDIISALASLTPGETHELHPATGSQPGIVVHVCEETSPSKSKPKVLHTRRPDRSEDNGNSSPPSAEAES